MSNIKNNTNNDLMDIACRMEILTDDFMNKLNERAGYGSLGTLNWVISVLKVIRDRIVQSQKIMYNGEPLTLDSFQEIVDEKFSNYVSRGLFIPKSHLNRRIYFKLENTEEGMDLVYTGEHENNIFEWIADLNADESLVRIIPTNVVYIHKKSESSYTTFLSEHNSCYVYDEENGKIKEVFDTRGVVIG